jgi:hypothetical protein
LGDPPLSIKSNETIVIHLDEAGNLTFSKSSTSFFVLTTIARIALVAQFNELNVLRERLIKEGIVIDYFHASEDRQGVRNAVFEIIRSGLRTIRIDSLIVEKCKTEPALQAEEQFYPRMIWFFALKLSRGAPQVSARALPKASHN